ncbi:exopolysaccharide Pel transporter PelG [Mesonia sp. MT50]|uniref:Exopolysaccharide Pel transporter PelG n=1 Tax=Mesonia profundi TaxID=3070998 RepID=A0ABU1A5W1_9FLAO|nr:exopolysaccharide Pel transporter PelG [Mesonia profundi]MDQ7918414.1 exopolysaccharide Pel transporter PelG [Mesonia profundi]
MSNTTKALENLIRQIKELNGKPVNKFAVAATIESLGIRDIDVLEDYGHPSILDLANYIYDLLDSPIYIDLKNKKQQEIEKKDQEIIRISSYITIRNKLFVKDYSTGLIHLFPVFFQIFTIIIFGFSLWTHDGFNELQSTAVVLGVILGLITTGGFVQVIGKQVSFYWYNNDFHMTKYAVLGIIKIGLKSILFLFVIALIFNFFVHLYPFLFLLIVFVYAFLIGALLLFIAPLYTIKQRWMITVCILSGSITSLLLYFYTQLHVYFIHWVGIIVVITCSIVYLNYFFKKTIKDKEAYTNEKPKIMLAVYRNFNYFFYGILLYSFVFLDRILAWSSTLNMNLPYIVYYEKDYEIGMDLAILVFFLLAGVLEYSIVSFNRFMEYYQRKLRYQEVEKFNAKLLKLYRNQLKTFFISSIIIAVFLYLIVTQSWGYSAGFDEPLSALSIKVFILGGFGYLFLTLGMLNVLYLYTLNQHQKPLIALMVAFVVNLLIGAFLSRIFSYEYSVIGMLIGSFVFMILTYRTTKKFLENLDYYYYAAY